MLKEIYPSIRVESLAIKKRPLLEWFPKADEFYGDAYVVPLLYEDPQGRSASLSTAITNAETSKQTKFVLTERKHDYGVVKIDAEAIYAASKTVGSFITSKDTQIKGMLRNLGKSMHYSLYGDGSGSIGQIASVSGDTVTLTNAVDVHAFGVGATIVANPNKTGNSGTLRTLAKVTGRSVGAKTVTFDVADLVATNSWAADDYLYFQGDYDEKFTGLAAWLPLAEPDSTSFFSVDRTADIMALAGHRVDESGRSIMENLEELVMLISESGGEPDAIFMNPRAGRVLAEEAGAKVTRSEGGKATFGFRGFSLDHFTNVDTLDVVFDLACPVDRAYVLQRNTWKLVHMQPLPHVVRDDGKDAQRGSTTDDIEVRGRYWGEVCCYAPGYNGVMPEIGRASCRERV